jgi:hypothetical protein
MEHNFEEFSKLAVEKFGDKVVCNKIRISQENLDKLNESFDAKLTQQDFEDYGPKVWLLENKCPNCGTNLFDLFGSFAWGIVHGQGYCTECNDVEFQYYHYIGKDRFKLCMLSLSGF